MKFRGKVYENSLSKNRYIQSIIYRFTSVSEADNYTSKTLFVQ